MNVQQLPHIFLSLVGVESLLGCEPFPNLGQLKIDTFGLGLLVLAFSDVGDEFVEAAHVGCASVDQPSQNTAHLSNLNISTWATHTHIIGL